MAEQVTIDTVALRSALFAPSGPVGRMLTQKGQQWKQAAQGIAPRGETPHEGQKLAESLVVTAPEAVPNGLQVRGQAMAAHGIHVVRGTRPHIIEPRRKKVLHFKVEGQHVFVSVVHHPGTKPNNFMAEALRRVI